MATCPHCDQEFTITPKVLGEEAMSMHITWEGEMIEAKTIGGLIENTRKLLEEVAKQAGMKKPYIGMPGIEFGQQSAVFHFAIFNAKPNTTPKEGGDAL